MIIDHIGFLFYPEMLRLRIVGRIAFPLFLFLVGYNHSFKWRNELRFRGILLQIFARSVSWMGYISMWYLNILIGIGIVRIILGFLQRQNNDYIALILLMMGIIYAPMTQGVIDYGSLSLVFGIIGYLSRKWGFSLKSALLIVFGVIYHLLFTQEYLGILDNQLYVYILAVVVLSMLLGITVENKSITSGVDHGVVWLSSHSLQIYVLQVLLFGLIYIIT